MAFTKLEKAVSNYSKLDYYNIRHKKSRK